MTIAIVTEPFWEPHQNSGDGNHDQRVRKKTLSPSEETILWALYDTELFGRQVRDAIAEVSENTRQMALGTIQPTLAKLERQKLVKSRWAPGTARVQGGKRRLYSLTVGGEQVLASQQEFRVRLRDWKPSSDVEPD